jgi:hypothetical protein
VAVDEDRQADYLARYYLLALGTGLLERVYWWQLAARGYGLLEPAGAALRRRPAFHALATLVRELEGTTLVGPLPAPPAGRLYLFRRGDGSEVVAAWSAAGAGRAVLPRPVRATIGRDGQALPSPRGAAVELGPSPAYHFLEP